MVGVGAVVSGTAAALVAWRRVRRRGHLLPLHTSGRAPSGVDAAGLEPAGSGTGTAGGLTTPQRRGASVPPDSSKTSTGLKLTAVVGAAAASAPAATPDSPGAAGRVLAAAEDPDSEVLDYPTAGRTSDPTSPPRLPSAPRRRRSPGRCSCCQRGRPTGRRRWCRSLRLPSSRGRMAGPSA